MAALFFEPFLGVGGLYYFNARYYDASTGRFINVDPIQDGSNWYVYCANNPLCFVDPTGLDKKNTYKRYSLNFDQTQKVFKDIMIQYRQMIDPNAAKNMGNYAIGKGASNAISSIAGKVNSFLGGALKAAGDNSAAQGRLEVFDNAMEIWDKSERYMQEGQAIMQFYYLEDKRTFEKPRDALTGEPSSTETISFETMWIEVVDKETGEVLSSKDLSSNSITLEAIEEHGTLEEERETMQYSDIREQMKYETEKLRND